MQVTLLKSKIHRAQVTSVSPDYSGSLSIDRSLMEAAGFLNHEKILVGNITNGERFETYCRNLIKKKPKWNSLFN